MAFQTPFPSQANTHDRDVSGKELSHHEPQQQNNTGALLGIVLILALGGGAAYYFLKVKGGKSKPKTRGDTDLDDYDYGADDDEYAEFEPYEDDSAEDSD